MRRGFTLIEVLIALSLMTVVLTGAFLMFHFSDKSRGVTATARSLQTAMIIEETLTYDLARLYSQGMPFFYDEAKKNVLKFYAIDPKHQPPDGKLGLRAITYQLEAPKTYLKRTEATTANVGSAPLESAEFLPFRTETGVMLRVNLVVGRTKDDPEGPPLVHTFLVRPVLSSGEQGAQVTPLSEFNPKPNSGTPLPAASGASPAPSPGP